MFRNRPADPTDEEFDWYNDFGMADQDPSNLEIDKFTLTPSNGVTHPPSILASPQSPTKQTITQTSPTLPTFPLTQELNAEAAPSSTLTTSYDIVTSQDTSLITPSLAHDATEHSRTPPTDSTPMSDGAAMSADPNQVLKDMSQLPTPEAMPATTQQNVLPLTAPTLDADSTAMSAGSDQASNDLSQLPTQEAIPADTQQTGGGTGKKKRRRRQKKKPKQSIQSEDDSMEAIGDDHQGQIDEVSEQGEN